MCNSFRRGMQILTIERCLQHSDILELLGDCYYNSSYDNVYCKISNYKNNKNIYVMAQYGENKLEGVTVYEYLNRKIVILAIAVSFEYRRKGIGKSMISFLSLRVGNEKLVVETDEESLLFYLKCGFKITLSFDYKGTKRYRCTKNT